MRDQLHRVADSIRSMVEADHPDDAELAYHWSEIRNASLEALADLEIRVIEEADPFADAELVGSICWASTPGQVELWCAQNGLPYEWDKDLFVAFDGRPDDETRQTMKRSGFRYVKGRRAWKHACFGRFPKCREKAEAEAA